MKISLKFLKLVAVHKHDVPRCGGLAGHDIRCTGRGREILCRVMGKGDGKFCLCVHVRI